MDDEFCWCCRDYGLTTPASYDGLCRSCTNRSPSACKTAHERDEAERDEATT